MTTFPAATDSGLGASYVAGLSRRRALAGAAAGLVVAVALLGVAALWAAAAAGLAAALLGRMAVRRLGGVTGDVLGAIQQLGEVLVLLAAVAAVSAGKAGSPVSSLLALVSGSPKSGRGQGTGHLSYRRDIPWPATTAVWSTPDPAASRCRTSTTPSSSSPSRTTASCSTAPS